MMEECLQTSPIITNQIGYHIFDRRPERDVMPFVKATVAAVPERLIWGTDWPHTQRWTPGAMCDDGKLVDLVPAMVPDAAVRNRMLVEAPARLFDLP